MFIIINFIFAVLFSFIWWIFDKSADFRDICVTNFIIMLIIDVAIFFVKWLCEDWK